MSRVAVIPGDGIGPEVAEQAMRTVADLGLGIEFDVVLHVNANTFLRTGVTLSEEDLRRVASSDAALVGAIGDPRVRTPAYACGVMQVLRSELDLYVNQRPVRLLHDDLNPLRDKGVVDCVVVRENTEGLDSGLGGALHVDTEAEVAIDTEISTAYGVRRIIDHAFSLARREVCLVDRSNAVPSGGALWQRIWRTAVERHPDVAVRHLYADTAAVRLVAEPDSFDVIVTNSALGSLLGGIATVVGGGLGAAASISLNPAGGFALGQPVHGSAPHLAGTGTANPIGAILSAALVVEHLGHHEGAKAIRAAVDRAVAAGRRTPDLGGSLTTEAAGAAIRAELY